MTFRGAIFASVLALSGAAAMAPVSAMAGEATADGQIAGIEAENAVATLDNGDFYWDPADSAANGPVSIVVSIPMQMAFVYRGGVLVAASTVSTGKRGKDTPIGEFTILQKRVFHRSNLYSNAPMPYMQRLTWDGIALHAGKLPGYPASHGCIRFPTAFARRLFDATALGGSVAVTDREIMLPARLVQPLPPPQIVIVPDQYEDARFNVVTAKAMVAVGPGEVIYGPPHPVIQPISDTRRK